MAARRTPRRVAQVLNALENFPKVTKEEIKLRKEQAIAERLKLKAENRARRIAIETPLREAREAAKNLTIAVVSRPDALSELAPVPTSGPIAPTVPQPATSAHTDEFLSTVRYDGDGVPRREYVRDRNGNPVPAHKSLAVPQAPQPKPAERPKPTAPTPVRVIVQPGFASDERLPPWVREGRQPTKAELAARHHQTEGPTGYRGDDWFIQACEARNRRNGGY